jgi:hypothetical protein
VDSEHGKNLNTDAWRQHQLVKYRGNPDHPYAKFFTGAWCVWVGGWVRGVCVGGWVRGVCVCGWVGAWWVWGGGGWVGGWVGWGALGAPRGA